MPKCREKSTLKYWEARLKQAGLSMDAGLSANVSYGFSTAQLDFDGRHVRAVELDEDKRGEWPVSV